MFLCTIGWLEIHCTFFYKARIKVFWMRNRKEDEHLRRFIVLSWYEYCTMFLCIETSHKYAWFLIHLKELKFKKYVVGLMAQKATWIARIPYEHWFSSSGCSTSAQFPACTWEEDQDVAQLLGAPFP